MRIGIEGSRLQSFDELILVFDGAVNLPFLRPTFQPRVDLRRRDAPFLGQTDDVLVIRDAFRSRELVDGVADRDDLFPLRRADLGLVEVYVDAALLLRARAYSVPA